MTGNIWMFSHLIDEEDLLFAQHDFITYKQAMEYYGIGEKPTVRIAWRSGSVYKVGKRVLIKREIFEDYLRRERKGKNG